MLKYFLIKYKNRSSSTDKLQPESSSSSELRLQWFQVINRVSLSVPSSHVVSGFPVASPPRCWLPFLSNGHFRQQHVQVSYWSNNRKSGRKVFCFWTWTVPRKPAKVSLCIAGKEQVCRPNVKYKFTKLSASFGLKFISVLQHRNGKKHQQTH